MKKLKIESDLNSSNYPFPQVQFLNTEQIRPEYPTATKPLSAFAILKRHFTKQNNIELKNVIKKHKIRKLRDLFIRKMKRNKPIIQNPENLYGVDQDSDKFLDKLNQKLSLTSGLKFNSTVMAFMQVLKMIGVLVLTFIQSLLLAFGDQIVQQQLQSFNLVFLISIVLLLLEIAMNFTIERCQNGRTLKSLREIGANYMKYDLWVDLFFIIDLVSFIKVFQDYSYPGNIPFLLILFVITCIKLVRSTYKLQRFEHIYLIHPDKQKYYALLKILIANLIIGHMLSIILNLMPILNPTTNWQIQNDYIGNSIFDKYIWGYYWGVNIMLTVGFGDLSATNSSQALILIFVETFSCIIFAYNINVIGTILADIKQRDQQRSKNLKIFLKMSQQNSVPSQLSQQIRNFIDQSYHIKQEFLYDEYDTIIQKLPHNIKSQYQKSANKHLFLKLPITNMLTYKTFASFAQKIVRKIAHPQELIYKRGQSQQFSILQKGMVGMTCRNNSKLDGKVVQKIMLKERNPKLINTKFLNQNRYEYDVKALQYSLIYYLSSQKFFEVLKEHQLDYQFICELRDKDKDQMLKYFITQNCLNCQQQQHTLFQCPKLHYIPLKQIVILKNKHKIPKMKRSKIKRNIKKLKKPLQVYSEFRSSNSEIQSQKNSSQSVFQEIFGKYFGLGQISEKIMTSKKLMISNKLNDSSIKEKICHSKQIDQNNLTQKILQVIKITEQHQGFWDIETDIATNYSNYFPICNSSNLQRFYPQQ